MLLTRNTPEGFEEFGRPEDVLYYRLLARSEHAQAVFATLKCRGMAGHEIEILLRTIAGIPRDWSAENEPWKQALKRRARMARKLRTLASEVANDPDLTALAFSVGVTAHDALDCYEDSLQTLAKLLEFAAASLEPGEFPHVQMRDKTVLTAAEFDRMSRPRRKSSLKSHALLAIFELLKPHFRRAPNRESEILASVLLDKTIKPGTVTQLRKAVRRPYFQDKE